MYPNAEDTARNYDFTTGDQEKIIDTVGNNHATIVNDSVVKWQPIVPVDIFTIGTGKDFSTLYSWATAMVNENRAKRAVFYETTDEPTTTYFNKPSVPRVELAAAQGLDFSVNSPAYVGIDDPSKRFYSYSSELHIHGIKLSPYAGDGGVYAKRGLITGFGHNQNPKLFDIDECVVTASILVTNDATVHVRNSILLKRMVIGNGSAATKAFVTDTVSLDTNFALSEDVPSYAAAGAEIHIKNCHMVDADYLGRIPPERDLGGNVQGITGSVYVTDIAGENYSLTIDAQTALAGKGWNGTDIASWAYDIDTSDPTTPISKSINVTWSKDVQTTISKTINLVWSKVKYLQTSITNLWSKSSETAISKDLNILWSKVKSVVKSTTNSWSKVESISKDVNFTWSKVEVVNKPITNNWSKTKQLYKDVNVTWSKTKQVNTTVVNLWSKDATISQQTTVVWSKTKTVSKSTNTSWSKTKIIDKPLTTRWSKLGLDLVKQITTSWSKVEVVNKPITNNWSKVEVVNKPITNNWSKTKQLSKDVNVTWSKISQSGIIKLINVIWSKVESISSTIISSWSKTKTVSKSTNISWSKTKIISKDYNATWSKVESISKDTTNSWSKVKTISKQTQNSWSKGVYSYYTKPLNVSWSKSKNLNVNVKVTWSKDFTRISKPSKLRTYTIPHTNRTFTISYESRKLIIKG